jgi:hypothetical protein
MSWKCPEKYIKAYIWHIDGGWCWSVCVKTSALRKEILLAGRWTIINSNMTSFFRFVLFDSDMSKEYKYGSILWLEDADLYLRLRTMSYTIYAAKFEQKIIHQHVHLRFHYMSLFLQTSALILHPNLQDVLTYLTFQYFDFDCTWWILFQKRVFYFISNVPYEYFWTTKSRTPQTLNTSNLQRILYSVVYI